MTTISERLLALRGDKSRRSFADELRAKESTLRNYEQGITQPTADFLETICNKLRISPHWLLLGKGPMRQGEAASQAQEPPAMAAPAPETAGAAPTRAAPAEDGAKQAAVANERLYQAWERERELLKELGELKTEIAMLKERFAAREQAYRDMRDFSGLREEDVGAENMGMKDTGAGESFAGIAPLRTSTTR